jgi:two-component system CheB/CheR fusion protein
MKKASAAARPLWQRLGADEHASVFPIVGIGASAGGLEALELFFKGVPAVSGIAFVVVQHLDPTHKGMLVELLQRATAMPVLQASDRLRVAPDHVYVIPPNCDLSILRGVLHLLEPAAPRGLRLPIDFFLRALAADRQAHSIGVVLSGMGSDGTLGLRAIKEVGGAAFVQEPASAKFDAMPRSAITAGLADVVAAPEELGERILTYLRHAFVPAAASKPGAAGGDQGALEKVLLILRAQSGHDFSLYKKSTIHRRIERRMGLHQLEDIADYVRYLRDNPHEAQLLFKELLIGVTSFFRDPAMWSQLEAEVLPALLAAHPDGATLRAWIPACSSGEEAYSLAIAFRAALARVKPAAQFALQIFATDLDGDAIDKARAGLYPGNIAADVSEERLGRYFVPQDEGYRVGREIREMVTFAPQNLVMDPPFTKLDLLTCRNLLIYLEADLQKKLLPLFHYSLRAGGFLVLGSAETVGPAADLFQALPGKNRIYQRHPGSARGKALAFPVAGGARARPNETVLAPNPVAAGGPNLALLTDTLLLQRFAPAAVLTTDKGDIVYISGKTGKYLEPAAGKANMNIFAMAREGLAGALNEVFARVVREGEGVTIRALKVGVNGGAGLVDVGVHCLQAPAPLRGMVLIVFTDLPAALPTPKRRGALAGAQAERLSALGLEVQQAREELQSAREEMQTSQEELKSTNEELQSTNEELQSSNEELTTSKEEMQSMNEELQTVNHELSAKVDELSLASDDMKNLLNSTEIATLFLDEQLRIRRYTTRVSGIIKLIPSDVGRPVTDLVSLLDYPALAADAHEVLRSLVFREVQVGARDGRWFTVRIMPYRTQDNRIDGVVITFVDISAAKTLERALRVSEERFRLAFEHAPITVFNQDRELRYTWLHSMQPGGGADEAIGKTDAELLPADDAARLTALKRQALEQGARIHTEVSMQVLGATHTYDFVAEPERDGAGNIVGVSGVTWDVTGQKNADARFRLLFEHALGAVAYHRMIVTDGVPTDYVLLEVNRAFADLLGPGELTGRRYSQLAPDTFGADPVLFAACARVAMTGQSERLECHVKQSDQWFDCALYSPERACFVSVSVDITERKRAEQTLHRAHALLQRRLSEQSSELDAAKALERVLYEANAVLEQRFDTQAVALQKAKADLAIGEGKGT